MTWLQRCGLTLCVAGVLSVAGAADVARFAEVVGLARNAEVLVTDARGVVVGVGRLTTGGPGEGDAFAAGIGEVPRLELRLLIGFTGPARLTLLASDGSAVTVEVVVGERVSIDGVDLFDLFAGRLAAVSIVREPGAGPPVEAGAPGPPAEPGAAAGVDVPADPGSRPGEPGEARGAVPPERDGPGGGPPEPGAPGGDRPTGRP